MKNNKIEALIKNWQKRNIAGYFCGNKEEVAQKLLEMIPASGSVGFSGSLTLEQIGILKILAERGNKTEKNLSGAEYYLTSANAISEQGELVFFSAYTNRTSAIAAGKNVIVVSGVNKLTPNLDAALKRARELATPLNCKRLNWNAACLKDGICHNSACLFPEYKRMCCQLLVIEAEIAAGRLSVVLVDEELGF